MARRTRAERERDMVTVAELYLKGRHQFDIRDAVNEQYPPEKHITQQTISKDIKRLHQRWLESELIDINEAKNRELERIDLLERTYWEAWERSCEDAEVQTRKTKGAVKQLADDAGGGNVFVAERPAETVATKKGQVGDPRFLQGVQWCITQRCAILGVEAPKKIAPTNPKGDEPYEGDVIKVVVHD